MGYKIFWIWRIVFMIPLDQKTRPLWRNKFWLITFMDKVRNLGFFLICHWPQHLHVALSVLKHFIRESYFKHECSQVLFKKSPTEEFMNVIFKTVLSYLWIFYKWKICCAKSGLKYFNFRGIEFNFSGRV